MQGPGAIIFVSIPLWPDTQHMITTEWLLVSLATKGLFSFHLDSDSKCLEAEGFLGPCSQPWLDSMVGTHECLVI